MRKQRRTKLDNVDVEEFRNLYENELKTFKELGEKYNVSQATVRLFAIKNGITPREHGNIKGKEYHFKSPFKQEIKEEDVEVFKQLFYDCVPGNKIAEKLGVSSNVVYRTIKEMKLVRPKSMMVRYGQYFDGDDEEMTKLYNEGKSSKEIAKIFNLAHGTVLRHLKHCGVKMRTLTEAQFMVTGRKIPVELTSYETMHDLYITKNMSKKAIGLMLNVDPCVIDRVLKEFGIHVRTNSESKIGLMVGEEHPNWKGGKSGLFMRVREFFYINLVKKVIERDGYRCTMCGSNKELHVHHIRHFKDIFDEILSEHPELDIAKNEEELYKLMTTDKRMNDLDNLITYCKSCHHKVHGFKTRNKQKQE